MSETTSHIAQSISEQIADLTKVIDTLTADRDRLQAAAGYLQDDEPTEKPVKKPARRSTKVKRQRGDRSAQILKLVEGGKTAKQIAKQTGAPLSYVYKVRKTAA